MGTVGRLLAMTVYTRSYTVPYAAGHALFKRNNNITPSGIMVSCFAYLSLQGEATGSILRWCDIFV